MGLDILKAHTNFPGMICKLSSRNEVAKPSSRLHWIFERKSTIAIVFCTEIIAGGLKCTGKENSVIQRGLLLSGYQIQRGKVAANS